MLLLNSGRKTRSYSSSQRYYWNFCWKCRSYGLTGIEINSHLGPSQAVVKSKIWEFTSLRWRPRRLHSLSLCWKTRCMVNAWWAEFMCMCILINVGGYGESGQIQLCDQDTWWMWLWLYKCTKKKKKSAQRNWKMRWDKQGATAYRKQKAAKDSGWQSQDCKHHQVLHHLRKLDFTPLTNKIWTPCTAS